MPVLILVVIIAAYCFCRFRFNRAINPVFLIVLWWLGWLEVAQFSIYGLNSPSELVSLMTMLMMAGLLIGSLIANPKIHPTTESCRRNRVFVANRDALFVGVAIPFAVFLLYWYITVSGTASASGGTISRTDALDATRRLAIAGKSGRMVLEYCVHPTALLIGICGAWSVAFGCIRVYALALLVSYLATLAPQNRFPLYVFLILTCSALAFTGKWKKLSLGQFGFIVGVASILIGGFTFVRTVERAGTASDSWRRNSKLAFAQLINYHTVGFAFMTDEMKFSKSYAQQNCTYGRSTIAGLDDLFVMLVGQRFNKDMRPISWDNQDYRAEKVELGSYQHIPLFYNAFYTVLHTLYLDGRWAAIFTFPAVFGWLIARRYWVAVATGSEYEYAWLGVFLFIALFSIFQSPLEEGRLWCAMIGLWLLGRIPFHLIMARFVRVRENSRDGLLREQVACPAAPGAQWRTNRLTLAGKVFARKTYRHVDRRSSTLPLVRRQK